MTRITPAPGHSLGNLDAVDQHERISRTTASILAHRPAITKVLYDDYRAALAAEGTLPPRLVELIRLRLAFHNQCRTCMAVRYSAGVDAGVTEELVCSLEKPSEASDLTKGERVAIRFADLLATDHLAIDDDLYNQLREHFNEGEIVELGLRCARTIGFGRLNATWQNVEHLPESFRNKGGTLTPWGSESLVW